MQLQLYDTPCFIYLYESTFVLSFSYTAFGGRLSYVLCIVSYYCYKYFNNLAVMVAEFLVFKQTFHKCLINHWAFANISEVLRLDPVCCIHQKSLESVSYELRNF